MSDWYILGAGNMGLLAAFYLSRAGLRPCFLVPDAARSVERTLIFDADGRRLALRFDARGPNQLDSPIERLILATKAWQTREAMAPIVDKLAPHAELLRLQNGLGSLDAVRLPTGIRLIEIVTTTGGWRSGPEHHIAAENATFMGDAGEPPFWLSALQAHWPDLQWRADIRHRQFRKLAVNAVINPLTALFDCVNGELLERDDLLPLMEDIAAEVDAVLGQLDPAWPDDTLEQSLAVARATAGNTSSMRSDMLAGRTTEIDYINGWIVRQAEETGIEVPENRRLLHEVHARHP